MVIKRRKQPGFTIVELLIVIVVIGILAAITIVVYNGVQQRANNAKTHGALGSWVKAMNLYKIDKGAWPSGYVCLGSGYKYGPLGDGSSGVAQCRQDVAGSGGTENAAFNTIMQPYISSSTSPAFVTARSTDTLWRRGINYYFGGGDGTYVYALATYAGVLTTCPSASGVNGSVDAVWGGNTSCYYLLGRTFDT